MNDAGYHTLREQIESLLAEARLHARQAGQWEKVETYWLVGDALVAHLDAHTGPKHGQQVVRNLSKDLHLGYTTLYEILRFRRVVPDPKVYARTLLGWSHFRALLHLPSGDQFDHYARLAAEHRWTTRQLKRAIEAGGDAGLIGTAALDIQPPPLRPRFGEPWTYPVLADPLLDDAPPAIDFGFHQVWAPGDLLPGFGEAAPGDRITLDATRAGTRARVRRDNPGLWTYLARVLHVVDGDTLDVVVDLGLGHRAFPRLRLRGIDTAELYTQAGRDARDFVEAALAEAPAVVISTWRTDTYGRYLADLKFLPHERDPGFILDRGTYLNARLLRENLATRYLE